MNGGARRCLIRRSVPSGVPGRIRICSSSPGPACGVSEMWRDVIGANWNWQPLLNLFSGVINDVAADRHWGGQRWPGIAASWMLRRTIDGPDAPPFGRPGHTGLDENYRGRPLRMGRRQSCRLDT